MASCSVDPVDTRRALGLALATALTQPIPDTRVGVFRMSRDRLILQQVVLHSAAELQHAEAFMKTVTVRQIPPGLARVIAGRARRTRSSVNQAVLGLLEEAAGLATRQTAPERHHDLDALAGAWTRAEANQFDRALRAQRPVDPDLWR